MIDKVTTIVADIDGTLVNKGESIMPITKAALEKLHQEGVLLGLSTGRKINSSMFNRAKDWGLSFNFDVIIGMNGGQLWDKNHEEIESYYLLPTADMKEIIERMAPLNLNVMIYEDDHMVTLHFDDMIHASMQRNHIEVIVTDGDTDRLCVRPNYNVLFRFDPESRVFSLRTKNTSYQMQVGKFNVLLHLYYGAPIGETEGADREVFMDRGFSPNYFDAGEDRRR